MGEKNLSVAPSIYTYQDYRHFLKDWLGYRKLAQSSFSLRGLAKRAGLSVGYLNMVMSGQRRLSEEKLGQLRPYLGLSEAEFHFFEKLVRINDSANGEERIASVKQLIRHKKYRNKNENEVETYRYLHHWYNVAIHELAGRDDFEPSVDWISTQLGGKIKKADIKKSVEFLIDKNFLIPDPANKNRLVRANRRVRCEEGLFRLSLASFHRQMFHLASEAMQNVPREERMILGHTRNISEKNYSAAVEILQEALEKIANLENENSADTRVYHFGFLGFPITIKKGENP